MARLRLRAVRAGRLRALERLHDDAARPGLQVRLCPRSLERRGHDPIGVSSFGHMGGVHLQNHDRWDDYLAAIEDGGLATRRAFATTARERLTRELILQLKRGWLETRRFERKFGVDVVADYADAFGSLTSRDWPRSARSGSNSAKAAPARRSAPAALLRRAVPGRPVHLIAVPLGTPTSPSASALPLGTPTSSSASRSAACRSEVEADLDADLGGGAQTRRDPV